MPVVHAFDTPGAVRLRVALGSGDIRVEPWDEPRTEVDLLALRDDEATRLAIEEATVEARERGDRTEIVVEVPRRGAGWGWALRRGPSVGVRVRCPHGADLDASTGSADVTASGRLGDVDVKTASGDLAFETVNGFRAATASGDVAVTEVHGEGNVKTASGDVVVRLAHAPLTLNLASGDAVVGESRAALSVATVSGDQEIGSVESGEVKLQSVSGDVRVGVRAGLLLSIDATSVSGSMVSELPLEDGLQQEGAPAVHLRARTVSGDVRIVRAGAGVATG